MPCIAALGRVRRGAHRGHEQHQLAHDDGGVLVGYTDWGAAISACRVVAVRVIQARFVDFLEHRSDNHDGGIRSQRVVAKIGKDLVGRVHWQPLGCRVARGCGLRRRSVQRPRCRIGSSNRGVEVRPGLRADARQGGHGQLARGHGRHRGGLGRRQPRASGGHVVPRRRARFARVRALRGQHVPRARGDALGRARLVERCSLGQHLADRSWQRDGWRLHHRLRLAPLAQPWGR
mmetsp:Transcript_84248/g.257278  ORF Transcript_84248/g.257278 Transcript_84248/m.257278 type:complete len:233 (-) Transcript_84248:59-757(-)